MALIDILELCNYDGKKLIKLTEIWLVTAVENGRLARDELLKEDAYFDLVLLDLMMPEMVTI